MKRVVPQAGQGIPVRLLKKQLNPIPVHKYRNPVVQAMRLVI
jgi:hypothetical protein